MFPDLPAGRCTIWRDQHTPAAAVTIEGGQIARLRLAEDRNAENLPQPRSLQPRQ